MSKVPNWVLIVVGILTFAFGGFLLIGYAAYRIYADKSKNEVVRNDWLRDKQDCQYKHFFENTGVALDTEKRIIYLKSNASEKEYSFDDIREWKYNISSGGMLAGNGTVGVGIAATAQNFQTLRENKENTGFFIVVRDIDFPRWRITFKLDKNTENEMLRWMEIFRQFVNNA